MSYTQLLSKKEFKGYFQSPAAYIVLIVFLVYSGWFFTSRLFIINQAELRTLFEYIPMIFLFFIPAITMGTLAREKNSGTIELLSTLPLKESHIVLGKFFGALGLVTVGLLFTLIHFFTIVLLGSNIDFGAIFTGYLGLFLLGASFSAIGVFASCLTKNQIIAFIISFMIVFFFFSVEGMLIFMPASMTPFFQYLSITYHLRNVSHGVIDTRNIVYFVSLTFLFLRLAFFTLESRKWK